MSEKAGENKKPSLVILGAGPTGLEAALAAAEAGYPFTVYEAASEVAGHMREWGHVRLFTPWSMNVSERMRRHLQAADIEVPGGEACPTGAEMREQLLEPIARLPELADHVRCGVEVLRVGRRGLLKHEEIGTAVRAAQPFRLLLAGEDRQWAEEADVVLDCTGAAKPNALGAGGIPAPGEDTAQDRIFSRIPNLEREAADWTDRRILLVGAGHSGQTALVGLVDLAAERPNTRIVWALRDGPPEPINEDALAERASLMQRARGLADDPPSCLEVRRGVSIDEIWPRPDGVDVVLRTADGEQETVGVDRILALTGRVGDHQIYRQLQVHECYATSGPMKLAAALLGQDGGSGDCLDQSSLGADTLKNPEPGFFLLGQKSYGRRNDFLLRVGWQQVDEVFELLA